MKIIYTKNKYRVETGNIHHIHYIAKINIANVARTHAIPPCNCTKEDMPGIYVTEYIPESGDYFIHEDEYVYPYKRDITGHITIIPGFNCSIAKAENNNELQIVANKGDGYSVIEPQKPYPIYEGEEIPEKSNMYSGGIKCTDTIKAINGINRKTISIVAGAGIEYDIIGNTIDIRVNKNAIQGKCEDECGNTN